MKKLLTLTLAAGLASLVSAVDFRVDISGQGSKIELENKDSVPQPPAGSAKTRISVCFT